MNFLAIFLFSESKPAGVFTRFSIICLIADSYISMDKEYARYLLNKTKEDYNLISKDFSRTRENIWEESRFLFDNYLAENDKVLDAGCANGRCYKLFKDKNAEYVGIDISEKLVKIAQEKYPEGDFRTADILNLPFPDNHFDKIYSIAVFHHIPSEEFRVQFLKEAKRVLKPEGLLILTVWKFPLIKEASLLFKYTTLKLIGKSKLDYRDIFQAWGSITQRYYHLFSKRELKGLIQKSGFKIKEIGVIKNNRGNRRNIYLVAEK